MAIRNDNMADVQKWGEPIPKGSYKFRIEKATEQQSSTGNDIVRLHLKCQEEPYVGRVVVDDVSLQKHALAKLKAYYDAVDYTPGPEGHDPETLAGKELYVYVDQDVYEGVTRNKVPPFGPRHIMKGKHAQSSGAGTAVAAR
jgi:hypothetical protein